MNNGNSGYFDTEAAKSEILYRRIGRNEMSAIQVCQELVAAEKDYYSKENRYAQKILSDEGSTMDFIGTPPIASPQAPLDRSWRRPLLRPKAGTARRLLTEVTIIAS